MFETLNGAGPEMAGSPDSSSLSEYAEEFAGDPFDASGPGFDNPDPAADVANGVDDPNTVDYEADDDTQDLPFHNHPRWKELMGRKKVLEDELSGLKSFAPVVERLRAVGITSVQEFEAAYAAEEQRQFEANLAQAIQAGVRNGTIPPAAAKAHFDAGLASRRTQSANWQQQGFASVSSGAPSSVIEQHIQSAKQRFPEMDEDMVRQVAQANYGRPGFDLTALARRSHERNQAYLERRLAQYEAERAEQPPAPISNERAGHTASNGLVAARRTWEDLLGLTRLVKT